MRQPHPRQPLWPLVGHRNGTRHEHPATGAVDGIARPAGSADQRSFPARIVEAGLFPTPGIARGRDAVARAGNVVAVGEQLAGHRLRLVGLVADALPGRAGIDHFAGQQKPGLMGDLGHRGLGPEIPHQRGQHVLAGLEQARDVVGLVAPVVEVAARRARTHTLAVHEKLVTVVGRDVDGERGGLRCELERAPEMVHAVVERRCSGHRDPVGLPRLGQTVRAGGREAASQQQGECDPFHN